MRDNGDGVDGKQEKGGIIALDNEKGKKGPNQGSTKYF